MAVPGDPQDNVLNTDLLKLFPTPAEEGADDCRRCLQYVLTEPYRKKGIFNSLLSRMSGVR